VAALARLEPHRKSRRRSRRRPNQTVS
jgi:hypothetical protein